MTVEIKRAPGGFRDWEVLLELLQDAFAYQNGRIDPPSSVHGLDTEALAGKAKDEHLFLAVEDGKWSDVCLREPRAGLGVRREAGRLATPARPGHRPPSHAGRGGVCAGEGPYRLELETRIELTENHDTFAALGFVKIAEHAHDGYDHPTFITMRKPLAS